MKFLLFLLLLLPWTIHAETNSSSPKIQKHMLELYAGYALDMNGRSGLSVMLDATSFLGDSPYYLGIKNILSFQHPWSCTDLSLVFGYNAKLFIKELGVNCFIGPDYGLRLNGPEKSFNIEALGIHTGIGIRFLYNSDTDVALTFAPVIRPYNNETGLWDFQKTYFNIMLSVNFKTLQSSSPGRWSDSEEN